MGLINYLYNMRQGLLDKSNAHQAELLGKAAAAANLHAADIGVLVQTAKANPDMAFGLLAQAAESRSPEAQTRLQGLKQDLANSQAQADYIKEQSQRAGYKATQDALLFPGQLEAQKVGIEQGRQAIAASKAAAAASQASQGNSAAQLYGTLAGGLRDDFRQNQQVSDFHDVWNSAMQLRASLKSGSAIGAQGAIIKLARIYDPGGVVREGEAQVYRGSFGMLQALQNAVQQSQGKGFTPEAQKELNDLVDSVVESSMGGYESAVNQYTGIATRLGVNPQDAIVTPIAEQDLLDFIQRRKEAQGIHQWGALNPGASGAIQRGP